MLDLAILGLLEEGELHGYEIRRRLREHLGLLANVSFGSLYPALARLEAAGARARRWRPPGPGPVGPTSRRPARSAASGRCSRPAATPGPGAGAPARSTGSPRPDGPSSPSCCRGRAADDARSFGLRLAFARHLAPQARLALLERRRAQLVQRLGEVGTASGEADLDVYARSVVEHTADALAQDVAWLDRLIEIERREHPEQSLTTVSGPSGPDKERNR